MFGAEIRPIISFDRFRVAGFWGGHRTITPRLIEATAGEPDKIYVLRAIKKLDIPQELDETPHGGTDCGYRTRSKARRAEWHYDSRGY